MNRFEQFIDFMLGGATTIPSGVAIETPGDFMSVFGGRAFRDGLYRVFKIDEVPKWNEVVGDYFTEFAGGFECFGHDWLGRVFALDFRDGTNGEQVLLFDQGVGEVLKIPVDFEKFHNEEIVRYTQEVFNLETFNAWLNVNKPPAENECVAHKIPLFLGGQDELSNMELADMEVNWSILGDIARQVRS